MVYKPRGFTLGFFYLLTVAKWQDLGYKIPLKQVGYEWTDTIAQVYDIFRFRDLFDATSILTLRAADGEELLKLVD